MLAYDNTDLTRLAATLRASENVNWKPNRYRRTAVHVAPDEVRDHFHKTITGAHQIRPIPGALGKAMQHTLLWKRPDQPHTYLEHWDLDAAAVDPTTYIDEHAPKWLKRSLKS